MNANDLQNTLRAVKTIMPHEIHSEDLAAEVAGYNEQIADVKNGAVAIQAQAEKLMTNAIGGKMKAETVAGKMEKLRTSLLALKLQAVTILSSKAILAKKVGRAHREEANRIYPLVEERRSEVVAQLTELGTTKQAIHFSALTDPKRKRLEEDSRYHASLANERALSAEEGAAIDTLTADVGKAFVI